MTMLAIVVNEKVVSIGKLLSEKECTKILEGHIKCYKEHCLIIYLRREICKALQCWR